MTPPKRLPQYEPATRGLFDINGLILKILKNFVSFAVCFIFWIKLLTNTAELYHFTAFVQHLLVNLLL